jgi:hypothetical protein
MKHLGRIPIHELIIILRSSRAICEMRRKGKKETSINNYNHKKTGRLDVFCSYFLFLLFSLLKEDALSTSRHKNIFMQAYC